MPLPLTVTSLTREYPTPGEPLMVLRNLNLTLAAGEAAAIVGPSGSGKSTLLNIIGTLDAPTNGAVRLGDIDPFALSRQAAAHFRGTHIGFVFQDHHLLPQCTAIENVLLPALAIGRASKEQTKRARDLLEQVGLNDRLAHRPAELSGGERQRVAIARALMNKPDLLLCDEPTGNLDAKSARTVGELLHRVCGETGASMICVTHSAALADTFARKLRMDGGQVRSA